MVNIVAMCPYCRAGGVRAPITSVGASATCPRCHSSFTVMPSEVRPDWASNPANFPAPAPETVPNAVSADVTEPSPVVPGAAGSKLPPDGPPPAPCEKKRRKRKKRDYPVARVIAPPPPKYVAEELEILPFEPDPEPPPAPAAVAVPEHPPVAVPPPAAPRPVRVASPEPEEAEESLDYGLTFALGALILVGPAVLASQLPFGRFVAAGLGVVGLLGGVAALGTEGRTRLMAAAAAGLHALILLVVFFIPSALGFGPWLGHSTDVGPKGPFAVEHETGSREPVTTDTWLDASSTSWECNDVRVTVTAAAGGQVELFDPKGAARLTPENYFQLQVRVSNVGVERQIDLSGWAAGEGAEGVRLTHDGGTALTPATFDGPWQPDRGAPARHLFPDESSVVTLYFAAPPAKTTALRLLLPGVGLGLPDQSVKFRLDRAAPVRPTP